MSVSPHLLVLGGARSGKSLYAERRARESGLDKVYLATAQAFDDEMRERIAAHRRMRAADGWQTCEEPLALVDVLAREAAPDRILLVDCLTLWLSNLMMAEADLSARTRELVDCISAGLPGQVIFVSNEVGLGIVPDNAMARAFRDAAGRLHQAVAGVAGEVVFVAAGLPLVLKPRN